MNQLTGIKDLDREILSKVPDEELLQVCTVDKDFGTMFVTIIS